MLCVIYIGRCQSSGPKSQTTANIRHAPTANRDILCLHDSSAAIWGPILLKICAQCNPHARNMDMHLLRILTIPQDGPNKGPAFVSHSDKVKVGRRVQPEDLAFFAFLTAERPNPRTHILLAFWKSEQAAIQNLSFNPSWTCIFSHLDNRPE